MPGEVKLHKFVIGVGSGGELGNQFRAGDFDAHLLAHLADGTGGIAFTNIKMSGGTAIPLEWRNILQMRALLKIDVTAGIGDKDMDGTVEKSPPMNFTATELASDFVAVIDDVEHFTRFLTGVDAGALFIPAGKLDPLLHTEFFGAQRGGHMQSIDERLPATRCLGQEVLHLLAALAEAQPDKAFKHPPVTDRKAAWITRSEAHHCAVHLGPGLENLRRNDTQQFHIPVTLHQHGQGTVAFLSHFGGEADADFLLQHKHGFGYRGRQIEQALHDLATDRIWQIADDPHIAVAVPFPHIDLRGIIMQHGHVAAFGEAFLQFRSEIVVFFNQHQMARPADKMLGHRPKSGTGLDNERRAIRLDLVGDPLSDGLIDEEVLPHALARGHFLAADDACLAVFCFL